MCQYNNNNNNIYIYIRKKKYKRKTKRKNVAIVAIVSFGIVTTVQNLKKKRQSGSPKWHCRCTMQKHCMHIRAFIYKKKEYKSMIEKTKKKITC